ncbi:MAG TPA: flagellar biosynthesis anti-sigma factor FlgM [Clostridiaceae bacterium]|nr:flagellar biosynthesis anti-sigma factor FlgM [Clostridiaceae bacterium]
MKIWGNIPNISGVYNDHKKVKSVNEVSGTKLKKDVVAISNKAKDYQLALKHLKDIPDYRADKVKEYTKRIESGNYDVKGRDIADKIIKSIFDKRV